MLYSELNPNALVQLQAIDDITPSQTLLLVVEHQRLFFCAECWLTNALQELV
jgi:hypothetical protein